MSLKNLFQVNKVLPPVSNEQIAEEIESPELLESYVKDKERIKFSVDFATASNFSIYGSAEKYYTDSFDRIKSQYPYDGSRKEKLDWCNESTELDNWIFDNIYPKSTGYGTFSGNGWGSTIASNAGYGEPSTKEYVVIKGGPSNNNSSDLKNKFVDKSNQFPKSNILDASTNRLLNLRTNLDNGVTVEFWLKKDTFVSSSTQKEVIFDLWNGIPSSSSGYGRLTIELSSSINNPLYLTAQSGTAGFFQQGITNNLTTNNIASGLWNHYAISMKNVSSSINVSFYLNGELNSSNNFGTSIAEITGSLIANIGAIRTAPSGTAGVLNGWGKLSGSIDDFRFWKTKRTDREIGRNWWDSIGAGTNNDDSNTELGIYYKFNEGITTNSSIDTVVLDYSGRICNGTWFGYNSSSRNTGSAINEFTGRELSAEIEDPIIYSSHPLVQSTMSEYAKMGNEYDEQNPNSLFYSLPNWLVIGDKTKHLLNLTQILGSYLDTLYLQIKNFTEIKEHYHNIQINEKPFPFSKLLLESNGMEVPDLFVDAKLIEEVLSRNENINFDDKLHEVKNVIYQNIYSNLTNIFKSKGTEKAFRNFIRCFGIDDDIVKLNIYSNNDYFNVRDNYSNYTKKIKSINFNKPDNFASTIYQTTQATNVNSLSYIPGSNTQQYNNVPFTFEATAIFPKKIAYDHPEYFYTPFVVSSIYGGHTANTASSSDLTWKVNDYFNFQVFAERTELESKDVKFVLSSSTPNLISTLSSSVFKNVYDNTKWNFAVRVKPNKLFNVNFVSGTSNNTYDVEFYGVQSDGDSIVNSFLLSSSLNNSDGINFVNSPKRLYLGAERTNFTGSVIKSSDIKVLDAKVWASYLTNEEIQSHAFNVENYGVLNNDENQYLTDSTFSNTYIKKIETLLLNWKFDQVTGSNSGSGIPNSSDASFIINDLTSGSLSYNNHNNVFNNIKKYEYTGKGDFFLQNNTNMVDVVYQFTSKFNEFENLQNSNLINILTTEEQQEFTRQTRPINYFFSFEKSMYQTISEEMLKMFGTIKDFSNLVGDPVYKYRKEYKELSKLRQMFFEKVQNEPDLDKYLDYYKWIDTALGKFLMQLAPASADTSDGLLNVIESHALERNKVQYKFPTAEFKLPIIEAGAESINKHLYNWRLGHRPLTNNEDENCLYWNERAERDTTPISSSTVGINQNKSLILSASLSVLNRSFTTPHRFKLDKSTHLKGGVNFEANKNIEFAKTAVAPHGPLDTDDVVNVPANYLVALVRNTSSLLEGCNDIIEPNSKTKYYLDVVHGRDYLSSSLAYGEVLSSKIAFPANLISSTVDSGYQSKVANEFMSGVTITNIHNDVYGSMNEIPVQGPFTNAWVGGKQSRHVELNQGNDTYTTRPEAWKILLGTLITSSYQTAIGFVGADYPYPEGNEDEPSYPVRAHKRATYFREETAKRPVNIKNIQSSTGSAVLGNYENTYEVLHSVGGTTNNRELVDAVNPSLQTELYGIVRTNITTGRVDYQLPVRQRSQTILRNKFSAPGDYRVNSRGYLNNYAEELSSYNALPFRNKRVIGDGRNTLERLIYEGLELGGLLPTSVFGLYYEQDQAKDVIEIVSGTNFNLNQLSALPSNQGYLYYHYIAGEPAGVFPYASLHKTNRNTILRKINNSTDSNVKHDNGFISHAIPQKDSGYAWIKQTLGSLYDQSSYGFVNSNYTLPSGSSSYVQSLNTTTSSVFGLDSSSRLGSEAYSVPADFAGLNTIIYDSASFNTLGSSIIQTSSLVTSYIGVGDVTRFNTLMLNRNGGYGYPSFKQIRNSNNKSLRILNKNNYFVVGNGTDVSVEKEPIIYYNKPNSISIKDINTNNVFEFDYSYKNLLQFFENNVVSNGFEYKQNNTIYEKIIKLLINNRQYRFTNNFIYNTTTYPLLSKKTLLESRKRNNYIFSAWKDLRNNRITINKTSLFNYLNNQNTILIPTQSIWPMDASSSVGDGGVLQNSYSLLHYGATGSITSSVLYNYKHMLSSLDSYKSKSPIDAVLQFSQSSIVNYISTSTGLFNGSAIWEAGAYGSNPYFDNYDEWYEKIRLTAKDYTVVPEYIISDDVKLITVQNSNYDDEYLNSISLTGTTVNDSRDTEFVNVYMTSNTLENIENIKNDLSSVTKNIKLKIDCNAIIKLNPKPEIYPQVQTIKIAEKFLTTSENYLSFWTGSGPIASNMYTNKAVAYRSVLTPLFAPGLLYNTIKSGIAVDYPIVTGTLSITGSTYTTGVPTEYLINNSNFDLRLPFETLVEPEKYLVTNLVDMEPHPSASLSITGSWSGQFSNNLYKLAINNFLAESVNFFLPDGKLTALYSKPENQFGLVDPNKTYQALVRIYKTADNNKIFDYDYGDSLGNVTSASRAKYVKPQLPPTSKETITMYSRPSAFGPSCAGGLKGSTGATKGIVDSSNGYNPAFTPPYYDGSSWAILTYKPTGSAPYRPTLQEIINNVTSSYVRFEMVSENLGATGPYSSTSLNSNSMQLSASLNLFNVVNTNEITLNNVDSTTVEPNSKIWAIQTKFETPILNFNPTDTGTTINSGSTIPTIGMWHQMGTLPDNDKGIFLQITDVPRSYLVYGTNGQTLDLQASASIYNTQPDLTGSLCDIVGFTKQETKLGQVANEKIIKEAVVAIPYVLKNGERNYLRLSDNSIRYLRNQFFGISQDIEQVEADIISSVPETVKQQIRLMKEYVIPPTFDFVNNEKADPISMYLFEFAYKLTQQDLINIWQGMMPNIAVEFEKKTVTIEHDLNDNDLITREDLTNNLKWLVFKVKQKAKTNYFNQIFRSIQDKNLTKTRNLLKLGRNNSISSITKEDEYLYSYNWPYDYFSLVELAKLETQVIFESNEEELTNIRPSILNKQIKGIK